MVEAKEIQEIRILSLQGQLVRVIKSPTEPKVSLEGLTSGMYLIEVHAAGRKDVQELLIE